MPCSTEIIKLWEKIVERTIAYINAESNMQNYTMQNSKNSKIQSHVESYHAEPKQTNCERRIAEKTIKCKNAELKMQNYQICVES